MNNPWKAFPKVWINFENMKFNVFNYLVVVQHIDVWNVVYTNFTSSYGTLLPEYQRILRIAFGHNETSHSMSMNMQSNLVHIVGHIF